MKLGTAVYEQGNKNYFSFGKGKNLFILRILPPMGKLAESGKWSLYHRVEFGYAGTDNRMKPFLSPRVVNFKKMVEVESLAHLRREKIKDQAKKAKEANNIELMAQTKVLLEKYNQDAKHYMNVIDQNGNIGLFKIGHRGFQALKVEIDRLRAEGIDPLGVDTGRFFVFSRSGTSLETLYTVTEFKQKVEIEHEGAKMIVDKPFPHAITETIINKLSSDAFELGDVYPSVTPEEEALILSGPAGVDKVFGKKEEANPASTTDTSTEAAVGVTVDTTVPTIQVETATVPVTQETLITEPNASLESAVVDTTPLDPVTEQALATEVATETAASTEMSEAEFFRQIEEGNV